MCTVKVWSNGKLGGRTEGGRPRGTPLRGDSEHAPPAGSASAPRPRCSGRSAGLRGAGDRKAVKLGAILAQDPSLLVVGYAAELVLDREP